MHFLLKFVQILVIVITVTSCISQKGGKGQVGGIEQVSEHSKNGGGSDDSMPPKIVATSEALTADNSSETIDQCMGFESGELYGDSKDQIMKMFSLAQEEEKDFEVKASELLTDLIDLHRLDKSKIKAVNKYEITGPISPEKAMEFFDTELQGEKMKKFIGCDRRLALGKIGEYVFSSNEQTCVTKLVSTNDLYIAKMRCISRTDYKTKTIQVSQ